MDDRQKQEFLAFLDEFRKKTRKKIEDAHKEEIEYCKKGKPAKKCAESIVAQAIEVLGVMPKESTIQEMKAEFQANLVGEIT